MTSHLSFAQHKGSFLLEAIEDLQVKLWLWALA